MRKIAKPAGVPMKMYRHFAFATVGVTGLIAIFANGENQQAMAEALENQRQQVAMRQMQAKQNAEQRKSVARPQAAANGGGGGSEGPEMPATNWVGGGQSAPPPSPFGYGRPASVLRGGPGMPGMPNRPRIVAKDMPGALPTAQNGQPLSDKYLGNNSTPSQEQMDKISVASAARSGNGETDEQ